MLFQRHLAGGQFRKDLISEHRDSMKALWIGMLFLGIAVYLRLSFNL